MSHTIRTYCLLFLLLSTTGVWAQQGGAEKKKARGRVAYIVCTNVPKDFKNPTLVRIDDEVIKFTLSKRLADMPVKIPSNGLIELVKEIPLKPSSKQVYDAGALKKATNAVTSYHYYDAERKKMKLLEPPPWNITL